MTAQSGPEEREKERVPTNQQIDHNNNYITRGHHSSYKPPPKGNKYHKCSTQSVKKIGNRRFLESALVLKKLGSFNWLKPSLFERDLGWLWRIFFHIEIRLIQPLYIASVQPIISVFLFITFFYIHVSGLTFTQPTKHYFNNTKNWLGKQIQPRLRPLQ